MNGRKLIGAAVIAGAVIGTPTAALATSDYVGTQPPVVKGVDFTRAPQVQGAQEAGGGLPVTGGDIVGLTVLGAGAVALGTVLVRRGRTAAVTA